MNNIKPAQKYLIIFSVTLVLFLAGFTMSIISFILPNFYGENSLLITLVIFFIDLFIGIASVITFVIFINQVNFFRLLRIENTYTLGHPTAFYNLGAFKEKANKLIRRAYRLGRNQYVIVFTVTSLETSFNSFKNKEINELNYKMALSLAEMFESSKGNLSTRNNVFGFNRGIFLIYVSSDNEETIRKIVNNVTNEIYRIVKENSMKVWAQPFFGVREIEDGDNLTSVIEDALVARSQGEANFESFTKFVKKKEEEESSSIIGFDEIEDALRNNEFIPYYQPKYSVTKKEFVGAEALVRWNSPKRGLLSPGSFIDKAEQFGLISAIDIYIFEKALIDIKDALRRGRRVIPVSCNFSLYEFFSHTFIDTIVNLLQKYQVPPSLIEIEITETTSQANKFLSVSVIKKLKEYGIRVLMDDYGVGFSQIQNLKTIPFDAIKIDKSFADLMLEDSKTSSIVRFLIELGHINDMEVIIEGVEKKEQVDILKKYHIDTIQGFYYSKALPYKEYNEFLKNNPFESGGKKQ